MPHYSIQLKGLEIEDIQSIISGKKTVVLSGEARRAIQSCRSFLEQQLEKEGEAFYGINTGFGSLCNVVIPKGKRNELQHNLIRSHAAGMGEEAPVELVRIMLLLKIQNLSLGYSGVRLELVERLITFLNEGIMPIVYEQGSLGASGDLAPLAHLSLPLIGEGEVYYKGEQHDSSAVLNELGLSPLSLEAKEGLALLNGTQFSTAYGVWSYIQSERAWHAVNMISAISMEAFNVQVSPLHEKVHEVRRHKGQIKAAAEIRDWLEGSDIKGRPNKKVQDPYAFRCAPQVHGATWQVLEHVKSVLANEVKAVTDNPNVVPETGEIISAGNFHAQPIALALDYLAMGMAELANISERRTFQLLSGERGLPGYLVEGAGLNSGFMIAQYTAASIVSQNKQYCTPASVDSIVSSMGQEDHVSMAANAATKLKRVVENVWSVLGIEFLCATQAVSLMGYHTSDKIDETIRKFRKEVKVLNEDRILHTDMVKAKNFIRQIEF